MSDDRYCHDRGEEHEFDTIRGRINAARHCLKCQAISLDWDDVEDEEYVSLIFGEAFRDDDAEPEDSRIRVYDMGDGVRYVGESTSDIAHACSRYCLAQAIPAEYLPTVDDIHAYVSVHTDTRPPFTYARTCDVVDFDPGDDPYVECAACGEVMVDDRRVSLSSGHFSTDTQLEDAVRWMEANLPDVFAAFLAAFPEWPRRHMGFQPGASWFDTEAMGVDPEWSSWCIDWIESHAPIWWEDGEPWAREDIDQ